MLRTQRALFLHMDFQQTVETHVENLPTPVEFLWNRQKKHCKILFSTCSAVSFPSSLCVAFVADIFDGVLDQLLQMVIVLHCRFNVADGVDNGGVVTAAEFRADRL